MNSLQIKYDLHYCSWLFDDIKSDGCCQLSNLTNKTIYSNVCRSSTLLDNVFKWIGDESFTSTPSWTPYLTPTFSSYRHWFPKSILQSAILKLSLCNLSTRPIIGFDECIAYLDIGCLICCGLTSHSAIFSFIGTRQLSSFQIKTWC